MNYRGTSGDWREYLQRFVEQHEVTHVVLLGEQRPLHRIAVEVAKARGIEVIVTDFGYVRPDWVLVERNGMNRESLAPRDKQTIMNLSQGLPAVDRAVKFPQPLRTQAILDMIFHGSNFWLGFLFPHYRRHTLIHPLIVYFTTGWRMLWADRHRLPRFYANDQSTNELPPFYVFAMQMEDDYSIRAYSPFADLDEPIRRVIQSFACFAPKESLLFFKVHPLDPGVKNWAKRIDAVSAQYGVGLRVFYVDACDLNALLAKARGLITVNSTAGLQSIELGCPTITLGDAVYDVAGLTYQGELSDFWRHAAKPDTEFAAAYVRLLLAMLHVRGGYYTRDSVAAAADGMAFRLHHDFVNHVLPEAINGVDWSR